MSNVNADGIVTPDEDDLDGPEVWSAAMADSISNGLGKRMAIQETSHSALLAIAPGTRVKFQDNQIAPYEVLGGTACRINGLTLDGGVLTVAARGVYQIDASASLAAWASWGVNTYAPENQNRSINVRIMVNGQLIKGGEVMSAQYFWSTASANVAIELQPNDTVCVFYYSSTFTGSNWTEPASGALIAEQPMISTLSIALVSPLPPVV